jgi:hypothetical protein
VAVREQLIRAADGDIAGPGGDRAGRERDPREPEQSRARGVAGPLEDVDAAHPTDAAVVEQCDAVGDHRRLGPVVRDDDRRRPGASSAAPPRSWPR